MPNLINVFITLILGMGLGDRLKDTKWKKIYLVIIWVCLSLVAGFRGLNALSDTVAYYSTYQFETQNYSFTDYLNYTKTHDTLYYMTNWIFARAGIPWQLYLTIVSLFVIGSFVYWIYCNSEDVVVSMLIFECLFLNVWQAALRQAMAMACLLWCYRLLQTARKKRGILLFLVAVGFHSTAVCFLPVLIARKLHINDIILALGALVCAGCHIFRNYFLFFVNKTGNLFGRNLYETFWGQQPVILIVMVFVILFIMVILRKQIREQCPASSEYYIAVFWMLALLALGGGVMVRLAWYPGMFISLAIPVIISSFKEKRLVKYMAIGMLLLMYIPNVDLHSWYFFWQA